MFYIGFDIGSSSIKASLVDANTGKAICTLQEPNEEMQIVSNQTDWAEQDPEVWWRHICTASRRLLNENKIKAEDINGIGIAYQMHGLVIVDADGNVIRNSIIWCDSRAVSIGEQAFSNISEDRCMGHMLNSPANFTASKLAWVKQYEPENYDKIHKFMLPGDFIAYKFSGDFTTTISGLSEGILWDFKNSEPAQMVLEHYGIDKNLVPQIVETFGVQSKVSDKGAAESGLQKGTPILYRAGDQPNNALSLNVFEPGEVATTGGTSGVLYAVTDSLKASEGIKLNNFAHVNHSPEKPRIGKLLCINGCGIQYRWLKDLLNLSENSYEVMNSYASQIPIGADNLQLIPFGNGAERMFDNRTIGSHISNLNLNTHSQGHILRAALEGIAFSFVYGMEILKKDHTQINVIRAGNDNLFRSEIFSETVATLIDQEIEIYNTTGAVGAARAAGKADGAFDFGTMVSQNDYVQTFKPNPEKQNYSIAYERWRTTLNTILKNQKD
ncbi:xylulokinase [Flagellimonas meridianipacifica]|uniref:Xylulokinase n=1 Tax=Flagellimonas meridianipacifica TaxID=1080225 RepID=A0A2T0MI49_9FLAO|nr:FGGY family carbohydrate kinase [Allomuricauda pacifica]PRX57258.1 xylulokinase [Allomuricauda pacifica]